MMLKFYGFICGAAVMLIEFAASRLLAPFFGTSIIVWGNIIGVVMIALAIGYYTGGYLADRSPHLRTISYLVFIASIVAAVSPALVQMIAVPLTQALHSQSGSMVAGAVGSFFVVLLIFAIPLTLLGMVSPFLIRIATKEIAKAGEVAGSLYAWSTVGSIAGTFLGSFVLIPFLGSRETVWFAAASLCVLAVIGSRRYWLAFGLIVPVVGYLYGLGLPLRADAAVIEQGETTYQFYAVVDEGDRYSLQYNEGLGTQSMVMKAGMGTPTGEYFDYASNIPELLAEPNQANSLVLGMASGTLTGLLRSKYSEQNITGIEIDPAITQLSRRRFNLDAQDINIVNDDGRNFLRNSDEQFDFIFVDVYSNELYIPWHMATEEFFQEVKRHQPITGLIGMNIASTSSNSAILQSILATIHSVYPYIYNQQVPGRGNYVVVASQQPIDTAAAEALELKPVTTNPRALVFTDNRAPAELFTEAMIWDYIMNL